jgi:hypothetical protein
MPLAILYDGIAEPLRARTVSISLGINMRSAWRDRCGDKNESNGTPKSVSSAPRCTSITLSPVPGRLRGDFQAPDDSGLGRGTGCHLSRLCNQGMSGIKIRPNRERRRNSAQQATPPQQVPWVRRCNAAILSPPFAMSYFVRRFRYMRTGTSQP